MQVVLIGPFQLAGWTTEALADSDEATPTNGQQFVYDHHESSMRALADHREVDSWTDDGTTFSLRVGSTRYGSVVAVVEVSDREELHAREEKLAAFANARLTARFGTASAESGDYPYHQILWWHRLLIDPQGDAPRAIRVFGETFLASDTTTGSVANGFSTVETDDPQLVRGVVAGLTAATEDWLMVDDLSRRLRMALMATRKDDQVLGHALRLSEQLTEEIALSVLLMDERRRHLANVTQRVHVAASAVWDTLLAREALLRNAESVQSLVRTEHQRRSERADAHRNQILFGFTAVTVLQSALLIADFATADALSVASSTRFAVAVIVAVLTLGILVIYMRDAPRPARVKDDELGAASRIGRR